MSDRVILCFEQTENNQIVTKGYKLKERDLSPAEAKGPQCYVHTINKCYQYLVKENGLHDTIVSRGPLPHLSEL